jgi:cell division protein FtsW (lipid II flippase)|tara:strand:+ start:405 stop:542 length:138 start_codon:yes stop_codon:yes gene_type:complete
MDEQLRIIFIIIISVAIFGLLIFSYVRNYIKKRLEYYLNEKSKKK